jgi:uncharacterized protein (DUF2252 family)
MAADPAPADPKQLRRTVKRAVHEEFTTDGRDPVQIIREQNAGRLKKYVPVRIARMLHNPFAFYRGGAGLMAHDLAGMPNTGIRVLSCGDAHISNFGLFASPERRLMFDLNDFDEAGVAPWEWDVKRLTASVHIAARVNGFAEEHADAAVRATVASYRTQLRSFAELGAVDRYFLSVDADALLGLAPDKSMKALVEQTAKKARKTTSRRMLEKITVTGPSGERKIVADPPLLVPSDRDMIEGFDEAFQEYQLSLRPDARALMSQFSVVDVALRVVGVGSVGTRCLIVLLENAAGDSLFLQVKEAQPSVLQTYGRLGKSVLPPGAPVSGREGYRVVAGQQTLQAASDPFLGWTPTVAGRDYYWRQFRDMKGSVAPEELTAEQFNGYGTVCGALLARAHAQSPQAPAVAGYLGKSTEFDEAIVRFAAAYTDQNERDFEAVRKAVKAGVLPCADESVV